MLEYDVVIVGAGPAGGSTALNIVKNSKKSVLIIEQKEIVGGEKARDTGGMSKHQLDAAGIEPPKDVIASEMEGAHIYSPDGTLVDISLGRLAGWVTWRERFDRWLVNEAERYGTVEVRTNTVADIHDPKEGTLRITNKRTGSESIVKGKTVVLATGPEYSMLKDVGLYGEPAPHDIMVGIEDTIVTDKWSRDHISIMFDRDFAPGGYIWAFPEEPDRQRFGLGIAQSYKPSLKTALNDIKVIHDVMDCQVTMKTGGRIPVGPPPKKVVSGRFCAIGGNAGHINPITGGGDAESMVMGKLLGELIANDVPIEEYEYRYLRGALGQKHRRMYKLRLFLWSLENKDLDWLAKQLQGMKIDPEKKFKNLPGLVIKIILKKPHWALRLARPKVPKH